MNGFLSESEEGIRDVFPERSNHEERGCSINPELNFDQMIKSNTLPRPVTADETSATASLVSVLVFAAAF